MDIPNLLNCLILTRNTLSLFFHPSLHLSSSHPPFSLLSLRPYISLSYSLPLFLCLSIPPTFSLRPFLPPSLSSPASPFLPPSPLPLNCTSLFFPLSLFLS